MTSDAAPLHNDNDDDDYRSSEDEDFDPTTAAAAVSENSDSDSDAKPTPKKQQKQSTRKRQLDDPAPAPARKIKTRAHRRLHGNHDDKDAPRSAVLSQAQAQRATDVDALWAAMNSPAPPQPEEPAAAAEKQQPAGPGPAPAPDGKHHNGPAGMFHEQEAITISRAYTFAGQQHTEHKVVPRDSHEARVYLASLPSPHHHHHHHPQHQHQHQHHQHHQQAPPRSAQEACLGVRLCRRRAQAAPPAALPAQRINTLEKSRLDWAGFVDKEGIGEELRRHKMGDKAYLERQAFLGRVEERGEMALKEGRGKGPV